MVRSLCYHLLPKVSRMTGITEGRMEAGGAWQAPCPAGSRAREFPHGPWLLPLSRPPSDGSASPLGPQPPAPGAPGEVAPAAPFALLLLPWMELVASGKSQPQELRGRRHRVQGGGRGAGWALAGS